MDGMWPTLFECARPLVPPNCALLNQFFGGCDLHNKLRIDEEKKDYMNLSEAKAKIYRTLKVCFAKRIKEEKKIKSAVNAISILWFNKILYYFYLTP